MAKPLTITLTGEQRRELELARAYHERPYVRERASAILKIANGMPARQVALRGLMKPRDPDTVYAWVHSYREDGVKGLLVKRGRGRKPKGSPLSV